MVLLNRLKQMRSGNLRVSYFVYDLRPKRVALVAALILVGGIVAGVLAPSFDVGFADILKVLVVWLLGSVLWAWFKASVRAAKVEVYEGV